MTNDRLIILETLLAIGQREAYSHLIIKDVLDKYGIIGKTIENGKTVTHYNYTIPMLIFTCLGLLALIFAFMLKAEDKKKGYGLEQPNIKK